ncbi:MAG: hypothetical protein Q9160_001232 [Pyrenula sp. 1 TL-2023]
MSWLTNKAVDTMSSAGSIVRKSRKPLIALFKEVYYIRALMNHGLLPYLQSAYTFAFAIAERHTKLIDTEVVRSIKMCYLIIVQRYICGHARGSQDGIPASFYRMCTWRTRIFSGCAKRFDARPTEEAIPWLCPDCHWRSIQDALGPLHHQAMSGGEYVLRQSGRVPEGHDSMFIQSYQESLEGAVQQMITSVRLVAISWHQYRERILREWLGAQGFENFAMHSSDAARPWWDALQRGGANDDPFRRLELSPQEQLPDCRESTPVPDPERRLNWPLNNPGGPSVAANSPTSNEGSRLRGGWVNGPPPTLVAQAHPRYPSSNQAISHDTIPMVPPHILASTSLRNNFELAPGPTRRASTISYGTATPHPSELDEAFTDNLTEEFFDDGAPDEMNNGPYPGMSQPSHLRVPRRRPSFGFPTNRPDGEESSEANSHTDPNATDSTSLPNDLENATSTPSLPPRPPNDNAPQSQTQGGTNFSQPFPQTLTVPAPCPIILSELTNSPRSMSASSVVTECQNDAGYESDESVESTGSDTYPGLGDFWLSLIEDSKPQVESGHKRESRGKGSYNGSSSAAIDTPHTEKGSYKNEATK